MLKGFKTMIVNGAVLIFSIFELLVPEASLPTGEDIGGVVDQADVLLTQSQAIGLAIFSAVNMLLRKVTNSPIFSKE